MCACVCICVYVCVLRMNVCGILGGVRCNQHGARAFSAKSEDIVGSLFAEGFGKMQKFKDSVKDIPVPLMADDKAIAKYAEKLDAARAKAGLPSTFELVAQKLAKLSSETAADDVSQSEFFMKADAYREELGLPKKTFEEVGAVLKDMKTKLDAAKTSADAKKVAKEFRDKLAAMEKVRALAAHGSSPPRPMGHA